MNKKQNEAAAAAKSLPSCPTLCDPIDSSPPGSPVPGILQGRTLEWVAIFFSQFMKVKSESEVTQSCPTLSDPMDCSPPGSSVRGILQARVLEWGAIAFSLAPIYDMANLCPLHYLTQTYLLWMWWEECDWRVGSEMVFGCPRDKTIFLKKALPFRDSGYHWLWT